LNSDKLIRTGGWNSLINHPNNLDWLRWDRTKLGQFDELGFKTTVFLGLFEGKQYLQARIKELEAQTSQDFYLLIVDNCSSDFDFQYAQDLLTNTPALQGRYLIVQNPVNLGGQGSFQLNLDQVKTPWITTVHQDDQYLPNHVATHLQAIEKSSDEIISVSTDLGSLNAEGKKQPVPPRANWFIDTKTKFDQFLAIVAEQVIPFPALSIRTSFVELDQVPWHTAAFSDSEQTLRALMRGKHEFIKRQTVLYRENPNSESHTQGLTVRIYSATLGLLRIFSSNEFVNFLREIPRDDRGAFAEKLEIAINRRISNPEYSQLLWSMCLEQLTHAWAYEESITTAATSDMFSKLGQSYTPGILNGILKKLDPTMRTDRVNSVQDIDTESESSATPKAKRKTILSLLYLVVGRLPYFLRRRIFQIYNFIQVKRRNIRKEI
jgi:glycosyltransferase involved in cell wall biosynthesis